jgi:uncharacterized repeat protein (TIGR03803 family)
MKRIASTLSKINMGKTAYTVFVLGISTAITLPAQIFTSLHSFDYTDGAYPYAPLVQATNGDCYGTTLGGGNAGGSGAGTIFKTTANGTFTTLYRFCSQMVGNACTDGEGPSAGLVQVVNGDLYGTNYQGGAPGAGGTVFKITLGGTLTTLYSFNNFPEGLYPYAGLVQATNGDLYGTTDDGGAAGEGGTVFKITPSGTLTALYSFCGGDVCLEGANPVSALVQATNGNFYGTAQTGGANCLPDGGCGTVFEMTPRGKLTTLYTFCAQSGCTDGANPVAGLVQATDGDFYGTTKNGGANGDGTIFKITRAGILTTLYSFCADYEDYTCMDGYGPYAGLIQATDGDFYGTTFGGGANCAPYGCGTIFKITPGGTLTTLYSFCSQSGCTDGASPYAGLIQATNGDFFGTTYGGGANGDGTVFRLSVGLGPFVETRLTAGEVGETVEILGSDLTGATSVSFHGTEAAFTVVSKSLITTKVPVGATSGTVEVVIPSATLSSNVPCHVLPRSPR